MLLETTRGDIVIDLYTDASPKTCMNFVKLCKLRYYDENLIFSVVRNFALTTGDGESAARDGSAAGISVNGLLYGEQVRAPGAPPSPVKRARAAPAAPAPSRPLRARAPRAEAVGVLRAPARARRRGASRGRRTSYGTPRPGWWAWCAATAAAGRPRTST